MKKIVVVFMAALGLMFCTPGMSHAGEVSVLLEKLVDKGILTPNEAKIIEQETKTQVSKDLVQKNSYSLPDWVQSMKLKGDARLRYQYEKKDGDAGSRNRARTRFRMGLDFNPIKNVTVGAGLSGGTTDPRSTNDTWQNTFERPDVRLDYASIEYAAAPWAQLVGGKFIFKDYLWQTTDMLWDTDINPYGFSAHLSHSIADDVEGFLNAGWWLIDENGISKNQDPNLFYAQGGAGYMGEKLDAKFAGTWYVFNGVKGYDLDNELNTNSQVGGVADAGLKYDYDSFALDAEFGVSNILGGLPYGIDERIAVYGNFIVNPDPSEQNIGWAAGFNFGNKKVNAAKQWQMKYQYVYLGKDAFPDTFPDSDRYGGRTDVKSHEVIFNIGLMKNVTFGVDYYMSNRIKATSNTEHVVQGDLVVKF